ncbi:FecR family protein [Polaribacter vadi]|uniref:FecR family protein n=1 Tax=Polaribacter vadi TaxID=1774273 RepID=UPI0030EE114D|tara:strand:+ start:31977 stop:33134 length:1158 start_codon:yes stop_codon:yes gene_type:complete
MNKEEFQLLIEKYLDGEISLEELKILVNYYESFQKNNQWVEELGSEKEIKQRVLINILDILQDDNVNEVKVIPIYKKNWFKYTAAATVALLLSLSFFIKKDKINNTKPIIVNTIQNDIKIGTDKAILTLNDGSLVALEKGQEYATDNIVSNGEELVYAATSRKKIEVEYNYLTIPRGGQYHIKLSDGTQVWLNSESQIKYPVEFPSGKTRQIQLVYGEAYFDVSPSTSHNGAKFNVLTKNQEVEVLGTEFNIKAYKDENYIYTTLIEGKVSVKNGSNKEVLKPNEQSILNIENKDFVVSKVDVYSETAWKRGVFSFKNKSLKDIMKVLSRWYNVDVVFVDKKLENTVFKGVLNKNQSIEDILNLIKNTNFINDYEINNNTIILKK